MHGSEQNRSMWRRRRKGKKKVQKKGSEGKTQFEAKQQRRGGNKPKPKMSITHEHSTGTEMQNKREEMERWGGGRGCASCALDSSLLHYLCVCVCVAGASVHHSPFEGTHVAMNDDPLAHTTLLSLLCFVMVSS